MLREASSVSNFEHRSAGFLKCFAVQVGHKVCLLKINWYQVYRAVFRGIQEGNEFNDFVNVPVSLHFFLTVLHVFLRLYCKFSKSSRSLTRCCIFFVFLQICSNFENLRRVLYSFRPNFFSDDSFFLFIVERRTHLLFLILFSNPWYLWFYQTTVINFHCHYLLLFSEHTPDQIEKINFGIKQMVSSLWIYARPEKFLYRKPLIAKNVSRLRLCILTVFAKMHTHPSTAPPYVYNLRTFRRSTFEIDPAFSPIGFSILSQNRSLRKTSSLKKSKEGLWNNGVYTNQSWNENRHWSSSFYAIEKFW